MKIPDEIDFMSFFTSEPIMLDDSQQVPFYYNQALYIYKNRSNEKFEFSLSPSSGAVKIKVSNEYASEIIAELEFNNVTAIRYYLIVRMKPKCCLKVKILLSKSKSNRVFSYF